MTPDPLNGLDDRLDRLYVTDVNGNHFLISRASVTNIVEIVREWLRTRVDMISRADYVNPHWFEARKVHDWRNYISEELRSTWGGFTHDQRRVIAENAQKFADKEN